MKYDIERTEKAIKEISKTKIFGIHTHACTTLRAKTWAKETTELKLFIEYFKPLYKGSGQPWFGSAFNSPQNQTDRHTALLFFT